MLWRFSEPGRRVKRSGQDTDALLYEVSYQFISPPASAVVLFTGELEARLGAA